eukprot:gnl/Hemi2/1425_TR498_c0_g1_i1.p2 gnl/Hemi2/1425_TR498_c0_g1~~gnl/Hemi2/1425_TR498_c0_g1_i1.p2  ORF type:complete len:141 (+),score=38.22 gnl/Hemi2/1425_TR498_c0_g1_i1:159-581(+)
MQFWMFNWLITLSFGTCQAFVTYMLGPPGQLVLSLWMVLNLSTAAASQAQELQDPFFQVGKVLPFYHCVHGARYYLFGSGTIQADLGVLFGYLFVFLILVTVAGFLDLRKRLESALKTDFAQSMTYASSNTTASITVAAN